MKRPDFRNWLQSRLSELNMRPVDLVRKSGMSESAISLLLSGKRLPTVDTLEKIKDALSVEMIDILEEAGFTNVRIPSEINKHEDKEYLFAGNISDGKIQDSIHRKREVNIGGDNISVVVKDRSVEPLARDGDTILLETTKRPKEGDFVFIKIKKHGFMFKRFYLHEGSDDKICLMALHCNHAPQIYELKDIETVYKVVSVKLK